MKAIDPHDLDSFVERHGIADPDWIREYEIPNDERFPTLRLPANKLRYSTARSYPIAFQPRLADRPLLFVHIAEGWEDAEHECMFACDERYAGFWRDAVERKRFGLTVPGAEALYPVRLGQRELDPIMGFLAALARKPAPTTTAKKRSPAAKNATAKKPARKQPAPTKKAKAKKAKQPARKNARGRR